MPQLKAQAVTADAVSFSYSSNKVLDNISFSVKKGDFVGVVGPNGAGKTTLIKIILGMLKPESGSITIEGKNPQDPQSIEKIGYVPQKFGVDKNFPATVREILALVCGKKNFSEVVESLGISDLLESKFTELSGGQQQRVMAALSLLKESEILILDEPAVGVDLRGQKEFYNFLNKLNKEKGTTIILVEHDVSMVTKYAKSVLCLNGSVCCYGPTERIGEFLEHIYGEDFRMHHHH